MKLVETIGQFNIYEHKTGKGVAILNNYKGAKSNGAIFDNPARAIETCLAVAFGGSIELTHRFKLPVMEQS